MHASGGALIIDIASISRVATTTFITVFVYVLFVRFASGAAYVFSIYVYYAICNIRSISTILLVISLLMYFSAMSTLVPKDTHSSQSKNAQGKS